MSMNESEKLLKYRRLGHAATYLAGCALQGETPALNSSIDLEDLYRFCKFHAITAIVAMALEKVWKTLPADPEIMQKWRQARDKAIRKNVLLNAERERLLAHLESIGCWYLPLKGSLLQFDYPVFGMRQMNDNDILFDEACQESVYTYMTSIGYEAVLYNKGNHDEYVKKPVYNFEMHKGLFLSSVNPELSSYYENVQRLMIPDPDKRFGYHMSENDFYIYLTAHAYKHYVYSGIGIRNLLDVYVFLKKHGEHLDFAYITEELKKFGADQFEAECRWLSRKLLENPTQEPKLIDQEREVLDLYFTSGTFGTKQQAVDNQVRALQCGVPLVGKLRYLIRRLFPSVSYMMEMEPQLKKKRWMIPFAYIRRLFRGLFGNPGKTMEEMKKLNQSQDESRK